MCAEAKTSLWGAAVASVCRSHVLECDCASQTHSLLLQTVQDETEEAAVWKLAQARHLRPNRCLSRSLTASYCAVGIPRERTIPDCCVAYSSHVFVKRPYLTLTAALGDRQRGTPICRGE